jgi:hypothetical protein
MQVKTVKERQILANMSHSFAANLYAIGISGVNIEFDEGCSVIRDNHCDVELSFEHNGHQYSIEDWSEWICDNILDNGIFAQYNMVVGVAQFEFSQQGLTVSILTPNLNYKLEIQDYLYLAICILRLELSFEKRVNKHPFCAKDGRLALSLSRTIISMECLHSPNPAVTIL